jgi:hypothetical protein
LIASSHVPPEQIASYVAMFVDHAAGAHLEPPLVVVLLVLPVPLVNHEIDRGRSLREDRR